MPMTSNSRQIESTAAAWIARRDGARWNETDQRALSTWLDEATAHRVAYLRLNAAWEQAQRLQALGAGTPPGQVPLRDAWHSSPFFAPEVLEAATVMVQSPRSKLRLVGWVAAGLLLMVGSAAWWTWVPSGRAYETAVGGMADVPMTDGSNVTLSSDSALRIDFTLQERRVELRHGEAYFEVAKDANRPFIVRAGTTQVTAVGTKFSVRRDGEAVRVVVTEGKVRVERDSRAALRPPVTLVTAGDIALGSETGLLVKPVPLPQAEEILSWRSGYVVFHDTPLSEAVQEFNRYNIQKIVIEDPKIAELRIGGNFRATNVDGFVRLLESGLPIRATRDEKGEGAQVTLRGADAIR